MKKDDAWMAKNFPTKAARDKADEAIDKLSVDEPMSKYLDVWVAAYITAGGKTPLKFS